MKRKFLGFIAALMVFASGLTFAGCDLFGDDGDDGGEPPKIDNEVDLDEYTPAPDDDSDYQEGETYYTSAALDLVTEIHGNYTIGRPFTLDKEDENKRVYPNLYFYEEDYFQVIYYKNANTLGEIYATLSDSSDTQYAEVEYSTGGSPLQINITQKGIYTLVLDIETFAIDMVKVGDIDTPVYERVRSCELMVHESLENHTYSAMTLDTATDEYYIQTYIPANATIAFVNATHFSRYKTEVGANLRDTLVYWDYFSPDDMRVHVGGTYKVYFHAKNYVTRLELLDPDTATYYCQVGWQQGNVLSPKSASEPYLFECELVATQTYTELPDFYPELGMSYALSVVDLDGLTVGDMYVKEVGTYKLTINLKEFTLTVALVDGD